jgi:hypothetical protein
MSAVLQTRLTDAEQNVSPSLYQQNLLDFKKSILAERQIWKNRLLDFGRHTGSVSEKAHTEFSRALEIHAKWQETWTQLQRQEKAVEEKHRTILSLLVEEPDPKGIVAANREISESRYEKIKNLLLEIPVELQKANRRLETWAKYLELGYVEWWATSYAKSCVPSWLSTEYAKRWVPESMKEWTSPTPYLDRALLKVKA